MGSTRFDDVHQLLLPYKVFSKFTNDISFLADSAEQIEAIQNDIKANPNLVIAHGRARNLVQKQLEVFDDALHNLKTWSDNTKRALLERRDEVAAQFKDHPAVTPPVSTPQDMPEGK